jgi:hypothetical protein
MKVLFLDIDDVLCSLKSSAACGGYPHDFTDPLMFDQHAIKLLRKLGNAGVRFVLSSTWRIHFDAKDAARGLGLPITESTPFHPHGCRGSEIAEWLSENPQVTHYAILDDSTDMMDEQMGNFVHVEGEDGMRLRDFRRLMQILDVDYDSVFRVDGPFMRYKPANGEEPM